MPGNQLFPLKFFGLTFFSKKVSVPGLRPYPPSSYFLKSCLVMSLTAALIGAAVWMRPSILAQP